MRAKLDELSAYADAEYSHYEEDQILWRFVEAVATATRDDLLDLRREAEQMTAWNEENYNRIRWYA